MANHAHHKQQASMHSPLPCLTSAGFILQRIHGRNSDKRIGQPSFHDITYVRQLLFSTFKSLHMAQRQLAFHHADLRLANIMEVDSSTLPPSTVGGPHTTSHATNGSTTPPTYSTPPHTAPHHVKSDSAQDTAMPLMDPPQLRHPPPLGPPQHPRHQPGASAAKSLVPGRSGADHPPLQDHRLRLS